MTLQTDLLVMLPELILAVGAMGLLLTGAVAGEKSAPPLRAVIQRLAELIPNSEVKVIPGASHGMNFQNPVALDAAILDFLERHATA